MLLCEGTFHTDYNCKNKTHLIPELVIAGGNIAGISPCRLQADIVRIKQHGAS